jgi:hypothetical protein
VESGYNKPMRLPGHGPQGTAEAILRIGMIGSKNIGIIFESGMDHVLASPVGSRDIRTRDLIKDSGRSESGI